MLHIESSINCPFQSSQAVATLNSEKCVELMYMVCATRYSCIYYIHCWEKLNMPTGTASESSDLAVAAAAATPLKNFCFSCPYIYGARDTTVLPVFVCKILEHSCFES